MLAAREAVRRYRQRGGDFAGLAINKEGGSYPAQAYRFLNLNEWSRFYGDRVFDPFSASSYFDQAAVERPALITGRPDISNIESGVGVDLTALNLTVQGLFFDPLAVSGPHRPHRPAAPPLPRRGSRRRPCCITTAASAGARTRMSRASRTSRFPPPSASRQAARRPTGAISSTGMSVDNGSVFVGVAPSAADRFLVFGAGANQDPALARIETATNLFEGRQNSRSLLGGAGWSHSFSDRNVLTGAVFGLQRPRPALHEYGQCRDPARHHHRRPRLDPQQDRRRLGRPVAHDRVRRPDPALRPRGAAGPQHLAEPSATASSINIATQQFEFLDTDDRTSASFESTRLYADVFWRPFDWFEAQAGVQGQPHRGRRSGRRRGVSAPRHRRLALRRAVAARRLPRRHAAAHRLHPGARDHGGPRAERAAHVARRRKPRRWRCAGMRNGRRTSSPRSSTSARMRRI